MVDAAMIKARYEPDWRKQRNDWLEAWLDRENYLETMIWFEDDWMKTRDALAMSYLDARRKEPLFLDRTGSLVDMARQRLECLDRLRGWYR